MSSPSSPTRLFIGQTGPDLAAELRRGLAFIDWESIVPAGARVAIKPNFCWTERLDGVTTRPEMLEAVVAAVATRTSNVFVVESDGISYPAEEAWDAHDAPAICARHGATLVNLSRHPAEQRRVEVGGRTVTMEFSSFLLNDVDVLITLPVLKTHVIATLSLGMKNLWGCIPTSMRILSHHILSPGIVALSSVYRPAMTIIDGTFGLDRRGPVFGDPVPVGRLIVSNNVVAADAAGARLLGFDPDAIEHIRLAAAIGLGPLDVDAAHVLGEVSAPVHTFTLQPTLMDHGANLTYRWRWLTRLVHASPATRLIYGVTGRKLPTPNDALRPSS